jgi:hypothetical protein
MLIPAIQEINIESFNYNIRNFTYFTDLDTFSVGRCPRGLSSIRQVKDLLYMYQEDAKLSSIKTTPKDTKKFKPATVASLSKEDKEILSELKTKYYWVEICHHEYGAGITFLLKSDLYSLFRRKSIPKQKKECLRATCQMMQDLFQFGVLYMAEVKDDLFYAETKEDLEYIIPKEPVTPLKKPKNTKGQQLLDLTTQNKKPKAVRKRS